MTDVLDRLSRRGVLTITGESGAFDVAFKVPWGQRTTDKSDLIEHCHLGAKDWYGEGDDLAVLLAECEEASRPQHRDVDELVWSIERRRDTRTCGPPLPNYQRWRGWRPGHERWLRTLSHQHEYLTGYLRDIEIEQQFEDENLRRQRHTRAGEIEAGLGDKNGSQPEVES